jgi:hypothetical protein
MGRNHAEVFFVIGTWVLVWSNYILWAASFAVFFSGFDYAFVASAVQFVILVFYHISMLEFRGI